jgi:hypothetical protein
MSCGYDFTIGRVKHGIAGGLKWLRWLKKRTFLGYGSKRDRGGGFAQRTEEGEGREGAEGN